MSNEEWLARVVIDPTNGGGRVDLSLYVYPDGHGNIFRLPDRTDGALANNVDEALDVLRELWLRAQQAHDAE